MVRRRSILSLNKGDPLAVFADAEAKPLSALKAKRQGFTPHQSKSKNGDIAGSGRSSPVALGFLGFCCSSGISRLHTLPSVDDAEARVADILRAVFIWATNNGGSPRPVRPSLAKLHRYWIGPRPGAFQDFPGSVQRISPPGIGPWPACESAHVLDRMQRNRSHLPGGYGVPGIDPDGSAKKRKPCCGEHCREARWWWLREIPPPFGSATRYFIFTSCSLDIVPTTHASQAF